MSTDRANVIVGVDLISELQAIESGTNLGVCIISGKELSRLTVHDVRRSIQLQVPACPQHFTICTTQGWQISDSQEKFIQLSQVMTEAGNVFICVKYEHPKVGIHNDLGKVIGFVHCSYNTSLKTLKNLITDQILQPIGHSSTFHFLDANCWPISTLQENHMTVSVILIGSCVSTDLHIQTSQPMESSDLESPPCKKFKGDKKELSFGSSKDIPISRHSNTDLDTTDSVAKQVLISYVRNEAANHALCLKQQLCALGFSVYLDVHEIQSGVDWQDSLNFAVSECQVFVPLVTPKYGETQWTNREVKLADVLGKYILPINFLSMWPPRCLAIQFATTQFIPWIPQDELKARSITSTMTPDQWTSEDIEKISTKIADRIHDLSLTAVPALMKRMTIVKSCACVSEDNSMATRSDREGKPLVVIILHPHDHSHGSELCGVLEKQGYEVWCTIQLGTGHMDHIDGLISSQDDAGYSTVIGSSNHDDHDLQCIQKFQEKADDASVVLLVLTEVFSQSRTCQQQVFYCEHRKRMVPILYNVFTMPEWMVMLIGSQGFELRRDENFFEILTNRVRDTVDPSSRMNKKSVSFNGSSYTPPITMSRSRSVDVTSSHTNGENIAYVKRPSLTSVKTVLL